MVSYPERIHKLNNDWVDERRMQSFTRCGWANATLWQMKLNCQRCRDTANIYELISVPVWTMFLMRFFNSFVPLVKPQMRCVFLMVLLLFLFCFLSVFIWYIRSIIMDCSLRRSQSQWMSSSSYHELALLRFFDLKKRTPSTFFQTPLNYFYSISLTLSLCSKWKFSQSAQKLVTNVNIAWHLLLRALFEHFPIKIPFNFYVRLAPTEFTPY